MNTYLSPLFFLQVGYILRETYGKSYVNCEGTDCFGFYPTPVGTNLIGEYFSQLKHQGWVGGGVTDYVYISTLPI